MTNDTSYLLMFLLLLNNNKALPKHRQQQFNQKYWWTTGWMDGEMEENIPLKCGSKTHGEIFYFQQFRCFHMENSTLPSSAHRQCSNLIIINAIHTVAATSCDEDVDETISIVI